MAVGISLALKKRNNFESRVFVVMGDGECNEGSVWEASMSAAHFKLDNLIAIVDYNKLQSDGNSETVMDIGLLEKKWESFGWDVISLDGHDIIALNDALIHNANNMKPRVIVAHTTKGKGVSFMENNNTWHHNRLTQTTFDQAIAELNL
jgi:transketolase